MLFIVWHLSQFLISVWHPLVQQKQTFLVSNNAHSSNPNDVSDTRGIFLSSNKSFLLNRFQFMYFWHFVYFSLPVPRKHWCLVISTRDDTDPPPAAKTWIVNKIDFSAFFSFLLGSTSLCLGGIVNFGMFQVRILRNGTRCGLSVRMYSR